MATKKTTAKKASDKPAPTKTSDKAKAKVKASDKPKSSAKPAAEKAGAKPAAKKAVATKTEKPTKASTKTEGGTLRHAKRLGLREVGALTKKEQSHVKEWLTNNFCGEDTFGCKLKKLADGGLSLSDPDDSVGGEGEFGVHLIDDAEGKAAFLVVLFQGAPEGSVFDRNAVKEVAIVSEGELIDIQNGYDKAAEQISRLLPGVTPLSNAPAETAHFPPPPGGPANEQEWRARFPEPEAQETIDIIVEGLRELRSRKGPSHIHTNFEKETGVPYRKQPKDPFEWLCGCKRLGFQATFPFSIYTFTDVRPLSVFTQFRGLGLRVEASTDLSSLSALEELRSLNIKGGERASWAWLAGLPELRRLEVQPSDDEDDAVHPLDVRENQKLKELTWFGRFSDVSRLGLGPSLRKLKLVSRLSDLTPLQQLHDLEELDLWDSEVRDLTPVLDLKKLWRLGLRNNCIRSIEGIERMESLRELDLEGNCITDFSPYRLWEKDQDEVEDCLGRWVPTQLDLSSPAGQAVHDDWFNPDKWEALAAHFDREGKPEGEHIRQYLATGESDEDWFDCHRLPVRAPS